MSKRLFRHEHPVIFAFLVLIGICALFWGGIAFFLFRSVAVSTGKRDIFIERDGVGVVEIRGVITQAEETVAALTDFRNNDHVKAVVVRIDSPGGAVGASQEIYGEIRRTAEAKPVVASLASIAASGGFYAALGAGRIIANPGTLTGSIGVIMKFPNLKQAFDKVGYRTEVVKSGRLKDIGSMERDLTPEERALVQQIIDDVHRQFMETVAERRGLPLDVVRGLADGRVFTGAEAEAKGLVDGLGNFTDAARLAARLGGLAGDTDPHLIYPEEDGFNILTILNRHKARAALDLLLPGPAPALSYEWAPGR